MTDIVLSEKQQKRALRKKKSNKQTIKNVLAAPEDTYWPIVKGDDVNVIEKALQKYLPRIRDGKVNVKYKEIANLSKEERTAYRKSLSEKDDSEDTEKKYIAFGLNHVDRLVCTKEVCFVLISGDVSPRLIVEGLVQDCLVNKVFVLIVPELREILKMQCGIKSVVASVKNDIDQNSKLAALKKVIQEICKKYPMPKEQFLLSNGCQRNLPCPETENEKTEETVSIADIYLKRNSRSYRVFCDFDSKPKSKKRSLGVEKEHILFNTTDSNESIYKPPVIKRVKNDPNRNTKKNSNKSLGCRYYK